MAKSVPETMPCSTHRSPWGKTASVLNRSSQARDTSQRMSSLNEICPGKENG
jgi:hypothetical protein